jgi:hypothetical protein
VAFARSKGSLKEWRKYSVKRWIGAGFDSPDEKREILLKSAMWSLSLFAALVLENTCPAE